MASPVLQHFERPVTVTVQGTVFDDLGDAVQGAAVNVLFGDNPVGRSESREDGAFSMIELSLTTGIHEVRAARPGYVTSEETLLVTQEMSNSTWLIMLRLNPVGWDDISSEPNRVVATSSLRADERRSRGQKYVTVEVFFATDRKYSHVRNVHKRFGNERSDETKLSLGSCKVAIPEGHRVGQLESPIFKVHLLEDPNRHVVLIALDRFDEGVFFQRLSSAVSTSQNHDAFVFIHGYNVTFAEAVRRTAQIAFDLNFHGAPICYSWPSSSKYSKYMADEAAVEWTVPHLSSFLESVRTMSGTDILHLIAHSMGNRALTRTLEGVSMEQSMPSRCRLRQIVLAAPDIDAGVFAELAGKVAASGERTTLYASSGDLPLAISQQFHAYPRAGEAGQNMVIIQGIDTIDASSVPSGLIGHSYFAGTRTVLTDIYELVKHGTPPPRFGLRKAIRGNQVYWEMGP